MNTDIKPYPKMKDSGVAWLGNIPEHWGVSPLGRVLIQRKEKNNPIKTNEILSLSLKKGVVPYEEKPAGGNKAKEDLSSYMLAYPGDIIVNSMNVVVGSVGLSKYFGAVSPVYYMLRPRYAEDIVEYFNQVFQTRDFQKSLFGLGNGIMYVESKSGKLNTIRLRIPMTKLKRVLFPHPPLNEQSAIVRYVDCMNRKVRRLIRSKRQMILLLTEQKQAVIHHAVTRGLNPHARLKSSGVDWMGEVPEHWEIKRLRFLVKDKLTYGANIAADHTNIDWPRYLRITDFAIDGSLRTDTFRSLPLEIAKNYLVQPGDILLARSGATVGKAFLVSEGIGTACHAGYLIRVRPHPLIIKSEFLFAFTQSSGFVRWKDSTFIIATIQNIGADKYANLHVPVPPIKEQEAIIAFLRKTTGVIDTAIEQARREVDLAHEYGVRLITDVITGKLDVCAAAKRLPDEAEELEPPEVLDAESDIEDAEINDSEELPEEAEA